MLETLQDAVWDKEAETQEFRDPFYISEFKSYVKNDAKVFEYGCGYGRLVELLRNSGYEFVAGYDFSFNMIKRGRINNINLPIHHIRHANLPLPNASWDAAVISTVLCCIPSTKSQEEIINEICRVLKPGGILYLSDFLLTNTEHMQAKYQKYFNQFDIWGVYQTQSGAIVRHQSHERLKHLLKSFEPLWCKEEDFVTMNNNPVRAFHGIYRKESL